MFWSGPREPSERPPYQKGPGSRPNEPVDCSHPMAEGPQSWCLLGESPSWVTESPSLSPRLCTITDGSHPGWHCGGRSCGSSSGPLHLRPLHPLGGSHWRWRRRETCLLGLVDCPEVSRSTCGKRPTWSQKMNLWKTTFFIFLPSGFQVPC